MPGLLSLGRTFPSKGILCLTDSTGFTGLSSTGGTGYDALLDTTQSNCREYRNQFQNTTLHTTTTAQDPLGFSNAAPTAGAISWGLSFLKWYAANRLAPGFNVEGIFCGIGGTTMDSWKVPGSVQAPNPTTRATQFLAKHVLNEIVAINVSLGTNDAIGGASKNAVDAILDLLCPNYRGISGIASDCPMIFTRPVPSWVAGSPYVAPTTTGTRGGTDEAIRLVGRITRCAPVDMTGVTGQNGGGSGVLFHYTAPDDRTLGGTAMGAALAVAEANV